MGTVAEVHSGLNSSNGVGRRSCSWRAISAWLRPGDTSFGAVCSCGGCCEGDTVAVSCFFAAIAGIPWFAGNIPVRIFRLRPRGAPTVGMCGGTPGIPGAPLSLCLRRMASLDVCDPPATPDVEAGSESELSVASESLESLAGFSYTSRRSSRKVRSRETFSRRRWLVCNRSWKYSFSCKHKKL